MSRYVFCREKVRKTIEMYLVRHWPNHLPAVASLNLNAVLFGISSSASPVERLEREKEPNSTGDKAFFPESFAGRAFYRSMAHLIYLFSPPLTA